MNHGNKGRKFGRRGGHRSAMLMNLVKSLIKHDRIVTTLAKAKDLKPLADKMVTIGKKGTLAARRQAISFMRGNNEEVSKLFDTIAKRSASRNGGYTRVVKAGYRKGDDAPMAVIEFVDK